ncbi:MAG: hypothetical protein H7Y37_17375, partial [Anaerolineae bacterium]|nr:hypothetical protein [Gloeobacterales cyanobacterium ES-bin-313]
PQPEVLAQNLIEAPEDLAEVSEANDQILQAENVERSSEITQQTPQAENVERSSEITEQTPQAVPPQPNVLSAQPQVDMPGVQTPEIPAESENEQLSIVPNVGDGQFPEGNTLAISRADIPEQTPEVTGSEAELSQETPTENQILPPEQLSEQIPEIGLGSTPEFVPNVETVEPPGSGFEVGAIENLGAVPDVRATEDSELIPEVETAEPPGPSPEAISSQNLGVLPQTSEALLTESPETLLGQSSDNVVNLPESAPQIFTPERLQVDSVQDAEETREATSPPIPEPMPAETLLTSSEEVSESMSAQTPEIPSTQDPEAISTEDPEISSRQIFADRPAETLVGNSLLAPEQSITTSPEISAPLVRQGNLEEPSEPIPDAVSPESAEVLPEAIPEVLPLENLALSSDLVPETAAESPEARSEAAPQVSTESPESQSPESVSPLPLEVPGQNIEVSSEGLPESISTPLEIPENALAQPEQTPVLTESTTLPEQTPVVITTSLASEAALPSPETLSETDTALPEQLSETDTALSTAETLLESAEELAPQSPEALSSAIPVETTELPTDISSQIPESISTETIDTTPSPQAFIQEQPTVQSAPETETNLPTERSMQGEPEEEIALNADLQEQAQTLHTALANRLAQLEADTPQPLASETPVASTSSDAPEPEGFAVPESPLPLPSFADLAAQLDDEGQTALTELISQAGNVTPPTATGDAREETPQTQLPPLPPAILRGNAATSAFQGIQLPILTEETPIPDTFSDAQIPEASGTPEEFPQLESLQLVDRNIQQVQEVEEQSPVPQDDDDSTPLLRDPGLGISPYLPIALDNLSTLTPLDLETSPTAAPFQDFAPLTFAPLPQAPVDPDNLFQSPPEQSPGTTQSLFATQRPEENQTVDPIEERINDLDPQTQELPLPSEAQDFEPSLAPETPFPPGTMVGTSPDQEEAAFLGTLFASAEPLGQAAIESLVQMPEARQLEISNALPLARRPDLATETSSPQAPTQRLSRTTLSPQPGFTGTSDLELAEQPTESELEFDGEQPLSPAFSPGYPQTATPLEFASPPQTFEQTTPATPTTGYAQSTQPLIYRPTPTSQPDSSLGDATKSAIDQSGIEELLNLGTDNHYQEPESPSFEDAPTDEASDTPLGQLFRQGVEQGQPSHRETIAPEPEEAASPTYTMEAPGQEEEDDDDEGGSSDGIDLERLARQIYYLVRQRIEREKERHGGQQDRGGW